MNTKNAEKRGGSIKRALIWAGVAFALFLLTFFAFVFLKPLAGDYQFGSIVVAQAGALVCIGVCLCLGGFWLATGKYTHARALGLLFVIGYILRLAYALYSPASARQHDTFSVNHDGHEAYAWTIFATGKLPTTNAYQFYHPPFNALIQAGFMKFFSVFTSVGWIDPSAYAYGKPEYIATERYFLFSACQILSVFYSCVTCLASVGIIRKLRLSKKAQTLACAFVILYPRNIQFAGMLNNDPLAYAFATIALYFAL